MRNSKRDLIWKNNKKRKSIFALFIFRGDTLAKLVHSGDFHLDSPYIGFPTDKGKIRAEEQLAAFKKIIDYVKKENVDVLLLAGDIFENEHVSFKTTEFLKRSFLEISDTHVFISPGNHDFISGNQVYFNVDFGENVVIFTPEIDYVEISDLNLRVYGYGFSERNDEINLSENMPVLDKSFINVFLTHASLPPYSDTAPILADEIAASGFDYIAAGHIHSHEGFKKYGETIAAYPGIPEGRHFDECGEKGFLFIDIDKEGFEGKFIKSSHRIVSKTDIDVSDCLLISDIAAKLSDFDRKNIYEITLTGKTGENVYLSTDALSKLLNEDFFFVKVTDKTKKNAPKSLSAVEEKLLAALRKSGKPDKITERALAIGRSALRGEEIEG